MATLYSGEAPAMLGATSMGGRVSTLPSTLLKLLALPTSCDASGRCSEQLKRLYGMVSSPCLLYGATPW